MKAIQRKLNLQLWQINHFYWDFYWVFVFVFLGLWLIINGKGLLLKKKKLFLQHYYKKNLLNILVKLK